MLDVTIDRSSWLRGEGALSSRLRRKTDGKMCCLGSVCLAGGLTGEFITDLRTPAEMVFDDLPEALQGPFEHSANDMMRVNDDRNMLEPYREAELIRLGALRGLALTFVGA